LSCRTGRSYFPSIRALNHGGATSTNDEGRLANPRAELHTVVQMRKRCTTGTLSRFRDRASSSEFARGLSGCNYNASTIPDGRTKASSVRGD
jgi:hypothetical protein